MKPQNLEHAIAVIGMSCRLPGARDTAEYWSNLCAGVESITFFSDDDLLAAGESPEVFRDPSYVRAHGCMPDAYAFDAAFFGVSPNEAAATDPQQRVFLECAWSALEDAGCDPGRFSGAVGVFAGSGTNGHYARVRAQTDLASAVGDEVVQVGNNREFLTTRVSYKLGLRGPSVAVQTACSTSLVAIHLACQSLLNHECDVALAGGVTIHSDPTGYRYQEGGKLSPDGHCRVFDARAAGTVGASGAGVVVLKRVEDALRDRDTIRAIVRGSAINNDGAAKIGFNAPSVRGQAQVIAEALAIADVDPSTIAYLETHGTGTPLGDPIEIAALTEVFGTTGHGKRQCALGAVKTNIGHVDAAAGAAGFIKAVLALQYRTIPPTLHFEKPNPETGLSDSPFYVNTALQPWETDGAPRRAGVSSFGIGGTNAHIVLEAAPDLPSHPGISAAQLLILSAKSEAALERMRGNLARHLGEHPELPLSDVAHTLQEGRTEQAHRWAAVARDVKEAREALRGTSRRAVLTGRTSEHPSVAFLFPGGGSQYLGMARELYVRETVFREEIDFYADVLAQDFTWDLHATLFPGEGDVDAAQARLRQIRYALPALFAVESALAQLWMSWGVQPDALLGHSLGEYVAACVAGVWPRQTAIRLVTARARLMQSLPGGSMLAVPLSEREIRELLPAHVAVAAVNSTSHCVVSGEPREVEKLETLLAEREIVTRRLRVSHASHSAAMDPILDAFEVEVRKAQPAAPRIPFLSNVTGDWITAEQATDPGYWARHLRQTVRFADGLHHLLEHPNRVFLEVGPGDTLGTFARRDGAGNGGRLVLRSLPPADEPDASDLTVLEALGALWTAGVGVEWSKVRGQQPCRKVALPTYPFDRTEYRVRRRVHPAAAVSLRSRATSPSVAGPPVPPLSVPTPLLQEPMPMMTEAVLSVERPSPPIVRRVTAVFARLLGTDPTELDPTRTFLDLGADSLLLMQASRSIASEFGVRIPFRRLLTGLSTVNDLSVHLTGDTSRRRDDHPSPATRRSARPGRARHVARKWRAVRERIRSARHRLAPTRRYAGATRTAARRRRRTRAALACRVVNAQRSAHVDGHGAGRVQRSRVEYAAIDAGRLARSTPSRSADDRSWRELHGAPAPPFRRTRVPLHRAHARLQDLRLGTPPDARRQPGGARLPNGDQGAALSTRRSEVAGLAPVGCGRERVHRLHVRVRCAFLRTSSTVHHRGRGAAAPARLPSRPAVGSCGSSRAVAVRAHGHGKGDVLQYRFGGHDDSRPHGARGDGPRSNRDVRGLLPRMLRRAPRASWWRAGR